jgi:hypothetical protein
MAFKWEVAPTDVFPQMADKYTQAIFSASAQVAEAKAREMETWAKTNAPWTDRTGAARRGLSATVEGSRDNTTIVLRHGVEYGLWLEVANGGRFAIIAQAIDIFGASLMDELQRMIRSGALPGFGFASGAGRFRNLATGRFVSRGEIVGRLGR